MSYLLFGKSKAEKKLVYTSTGLNLDRNQEFKYKQVRSTAQDAAPWARKEKEKWIDLH